jgi:hypothetical protein
MKPGQSVRLCPDGVSAFLRRESMNSLLKADGHFFSIGCPVSAFLREGQ